MVLRLGSFSSWAATVAPAAPTTTLGWFGCVCVFVCVCGYSFPICVFPNLLKPCLYLHLNMIQLFRPLFMKT